MTDEVKRHNTRKSVWMVIRNEVYDVTSFVDEHPGGEDPMLDAAGQDATIAFEDIGHSEDAKAMLKKYKIGSLAPGEGCCKMRAKLWRSSSSSRLKYALLALGVAVLLGIAYKKYASS
ncbi:hypothetical protein HW555_003534 [Spodoptera exigua]|uniref:Cytochrome b5 heme-binding domain-containing protein n=1 Tax=Spodoptera exigua TaxID=7107 RepID=A0A835L655_SPOEX|nr:hypothetical protein HW555_003534 [Spodoptera exigua]